MADFWKIVEVNTGICVPKYLKDVLMLYGYDDASSIESITMVDIDSIEEFVKSGIDEHIGDGEAKDVYHRFPNRKYQFIVTKGDRVKLMDVVEFVRNKLASEGGYKFFYRSAEIIQQTLESTSSRSLHSQELPAVLSIDNDDNQPIKTESNLNDGKLLVSSTTGVLENSHDDTNIVESLPTNQNRITSFSSEERSDDVKDDNLLVPLRLRTPSPSAIKIFSRHENVKVEVETDTKDEVDFTKDCENMTKSTSHLSMENPITVSPLNIRRCQVKILQIPQIGSSSRVNQPPLAHKVKKGLMISQTTDVDRESNIGDKTLKDENSVIQRCSCDICGKICKSKDRIKQHMKLHTGVKLHVCSFCGYATPSNSVLRHHLRIHTGEKPYVCDVCSKTFIEASKLSEHKRIHTGERPFVCDICSKAFRCSTNLLAHKRIHTGEKPYVCDVCPKKFSLASNLSVHKRIHTGEKPFVCDVCPKTFSQSSTLSAHKKIHAGEKLVCDVCLKTFSQASYLSVHKRIHNSERFACAVCPKTFSQYSNLSAHKKIHTGERFACTVCPKTFSRSSNLTAHKRIHAGEKPFVCDVCSKAFSRSSNLSEHKRIHTGERVVCDICPKTFSQSAQLSVHKRIHTGEKRCLS